MYIHNKNGDIFIMTTCLMIISIPDAAYVVEIDNKMPQKHFTSLSLVKYLDHKTKECSLARNIFKVVY